MTKDIFRIFTESRWRKLESEQVLECLKTLLDSVKPMGKHTKIEGCNSDSVEYVLKSAIELIEWHETERESLSAYL